MKSSKYNRRKFLSTAAASTASGVFLNSAFPFSAAEAKTNSPFSALGSESEYLFAEGLTYLNTGTIGPCRRETVRESMKMWEELESFPVKSYGGWGAEGLAEKTRTVAARFLGCDLSEMLITTSTTNGMNAVAQGLRLKAGDRILLTDQEHSGGLHCWQYCAKYYDVKIDTVAVQNGENDAEAILDRIKKALTAKTRAISVSHIFSSTGLRMPVAEISALARSKGVLCIVDGAQSAGAIKVNVKELGCHAYATSGHKWLMGPKGTGLLYLSKDAQEIVRPMQFDDSYNTYNNGNGVVNLACILGLAKAIEYLERVGIAKVEEHNLSLRNKLYEKLEKIKSIKLVSPAPGRFASPMVAVVLPDAVDRTVFVRMLFEKHKLSIRATHKEFGFNGIRFSTHVFNTEKEVDFAAEVVRKELT